MARRGLDGSHRRLRLLSCVGAAVLLGSAAHAQGILDQYIAPSNGGVANESGVTVTSRARPDYESSGVRVGSFLLHGSLSEAMGYESNVLGTPRPQGSPVVQTNAAADAASDVSTVSVRAAVTVDDERFLTQSSQSYTNWTATLAGTYELGPDLISAQYQHLHLNQTVQDLDVPQLQQPVPYDVDTVRGSYRASFNRLSLTPALDVSTYNYGSGLVLGSPYQQDYRNRVLVTPSLVSAYEVAPGRNLVLVVRDGIASYSGSQPGFPSRNYNDAAVLGGIGFNGTALVRVRALAGYEVRTFDSAQYKTISAPIVELDATWTPTGLTTVRAIASRRIQDSADETTAGYTETSAGLRLDHELLRNVLLSGNVSFDHIQYGEGGGTQRLWYTGAAATYFLNRNVGLTASYDFTARGSSGSQPVLGTNGQQLGGDYQNHRVLLQLRLNL